MHQDHKAEISKRVELLQQIFRDSREMEFPKVFQTIFGKKTPEICSVSFIS